MVPKYMFLNRCFLVLIVFLYSNFRVLKAQETGSSVALVYIEYLNSRISKKGVVDAESRHIIFSKDGDLSSKYVMSTQQGSYTLSSAVYDNHLTLIGFKSGDEYIPVIKEDTLYRSESEYFIPEEFIVPQNINYVHSITGSKGIEINKVKMNSGVLFILSKCQEGILEITNLTLSPTSSINITGISVSIEKPDVYFLGSFRYYNPPPPVKGDTYYMPDKGNIENIPLGEPDEREILNKMLEAGILKNYNEMFEKRLSVIAE